MDNEANEVKTQKINSKPLLVKISRVGKNGIKIQELMSDNPEMVIEIFRYQHTIGIWFKNLPQNDKK